MSGESKRPRVSSMDTSNAERNAKIAVDNDGNVIQATIDVQHPLMTSVSPSIAVALHPLVIMNVSEHYTRVKAQEGKPSPQVYGAILGKQDGRNMELLNSFELQVDAIEDFTMINMDYFKMKVDQFRQVFQDLDFLGWYTTGDIVNPQDIKIHRQLLDENESCIFMKLDPLSKTGKLPLSVYESILDLVDGQQRILFIDVPYTLATEEAERIGVDHVARLSTTGVSETSAAAEHLSVQHSAIKMLHNRVQAISEYVRSVANGELPVNQVIMRECASLCQRLPLLTTPQFKEEYYDECNDAALMTFLATITKGCNSANELIKKFNLTYDRHGVGRRMRGYMF